MATTKSKPSDPSPEIALRNFLAVFGDPEKVAEELVNHWNETKKLGHPTEIYSRLMDDRVASGEIAEQKAGILRAVFSDSFNPERATGYLAKHRAPIVTGLAQLYADTQPQTTWRIDGDISNLGGLNKAMQISAHALRDKDKAAFARLLAENKISPDAPDATDKLGRVMADRVLHTICNITQEHLETIADVIPIRKGGDEITFIATGKNGQNLDSDTIRKVIKTTQKDVVQFVLAAGIELIPHGKDLGNRTKAGIGIGLHEIDISKHGLDTQRGLLEDGIGESKIDFQKILHPTLHRKSNDEITPPDLKNMEVNITRLGNYFAPAVPEIHTVIPQLNIPGGSVPNVQRLMNLEKTARNDGSKPTKAEIRAIAGTHLSIRKNDTVTNVPMFENMQEEQLPYFMQQFGNKAGGAKLINIDFSGMAGGNKLSEVIGDEMAKSYTAVVKAAMKQSGLAEYEYALAVRPGGKFALLVPATITDENFAAFNTSLKVNLDSKSGEPLPMTPRIRGALQEAITGYIDPSEMSPEKYNAETKKKLELQALYGRNGEKLFDTDEQITMARILNPKTKLAGSTVAVAISETAINPNKSLGDQLSLLESATNRQHEAITREREGFSARFGTRSPSSTGRY